jgi:hypothetical protein
MAHSKAKLDQRLRTKGCPASTILSAKTWIIHTLRKAWATNRSRAITIPL